MLQQRQRCRHGIHLIRLKNVTASSDALTLMRFSFLFAWLAFSTYWLWPFTVIADRLFSSFEMLITLGDAESGIFAIRMTIFAVNEEIFAARLIIVQMIDEEQMMAFFRLLAQEYHSSA